jgi:hypothetical protein
MLNPKTYKDSHHDKLSRYAYSVAIVGMIVLIIWCSYMAGTGGQAPTLPAIVPLCKAGNAFDTTKYPQNWPHSDPMNFTCTWDGNGRVYLSKEKSSLTGIYADDGFTVDTPKGIRFAAKGHSAHQNPHPPLDITDGLYPGSNNLTLIIQNYQGLSMFYGSSTGYGTDQTPYIIEVNDPSLITGR